MTNAEGPDAVDTPEVTPVEETVAPALGSRIFLALTVFFLVLAVVYWFVSDYEWAGSVLLLLSAGLSVVVGGFLVLVDRRGGLREELEVADYDDPALFLPHASLRPFWMGLGCILLASGLALGIWLMLPGAILLAIGAIGMVEEGRRR